MDKETAKKFFELVVKNSEKSAAEFAICLIQDFDLSLNSTTQSDKHQNTEINQESPQEHFRKMLEHGYNGVNYIERADRLSDMKDKIQQKISNQEQLDPITPNLKKEMDINSIFESFGGEKIEKDRDFYTSLTQNMKSIKDILDPFLNVENLVETNIIEKESVSNNPEHNTTLFDKNFFQRKSE